MLAAVVHVTRMLDKLGSRVEMIMSLAVTSFFFQISMASVAELDPITVCIGHKSLPSATSRSSCHSNKC